MNMASQLPRVAVVGLFTATLMALAPILPAEAGPHARGNARASLNRAPPPHAQGANRIDTGNLSRQNVHSANVGNRLNSGNNNRVGNRTAINNSHNNVNIDNHRDINIDVDDHGHGHYGYDDHYYHPIATAAAVTATVAVTAAVVGAIVRPAQLPSNCVQVVQGNVAYLQCGSVWYQPQYQGSDITYVVVNAP